MYRCEKTEGERKERGGVKKKRFPKVFNGCGEFETAQGNADGVDHSEEAVVVLKRTV